MPIDIAPPEDMYGIGDAAQHSAAQCVKTLVVEMAVR
jgi:hypothetical protein